jgi:hypothetical protein
MMLRIFFDAFFIVASTQLLVRVKLPIQSRAGLGADRITELTESQYLAGILLSACPCRFN